MRGSCNELNSVNQTASADTRDSLLGTEHIEITFSWNDGGGVCDLTNRPRNASVELELTLACPFDAIGESLKLSPHCCDQLDLVDRICLTARNLLTDCIKPPSTLSFNFHTISILGFISFLTSGRLFRRSRLSRLAITPTSFLFLLFEDKAIT